MERTPDNLTGVTPPTVDRILVGVSLDGSDERVLQAAGALCQRTHARLIVVHAEEEPGGLLLEAGGAAPEPDRDQVRSSVERWLPAGVGYTLHVVPGPAHRALMEVAARTSPQLVVVGASAGDGKLLGSTAERVARKAAVPVLVVRGRLSEPARQVVAPVDLSDLSACGLHLGLGMAWQLAGKARLHVVVPFAIGFLDPMSREMRQQGTTTEEMTARARAKLEALVARHLPGVPLDVEPRVILGPAREVIAGTAKAEGCDLAVMSTHGYGGFERLILGSVAASVLREAPCSVLLVPPEAARCDDMAEAIASETAPGRHVDR